MVTNLLTSLNPQDALPVLALNAGGEVPFHVPGTETTLLLGLRPSADPHLRSAILHLLSRCVTNVENIIDVAGDGVIPGPYNMYRIIMRETHVTVEFLALSNYPEGPPDQKLTYMVLFNALKGLRTVFNRERQWLSLHYYKIQQGDKGVIASGYMLLPDAHMAKASHLYPQFQASITSTAKNTEIYVVHGGNGPPLLLLHGFPQTHLLWHKVAQELSKHYTLIIPDLRGYGYSSKPTSPDPNDHSHHSKSAMAADCVALMDSCDYPTFYICGHDRGARVAHSLCVNFPQRVKKCILLDICPTRAMYAATDRSFAQAYWHWFFLIQPTPFPEDAITAAASVFASKSLLQRDILGEAYDEYAKQFTDWPTVHAMCEGGFGGTDGG
ncbi:MAG: hypothetical protein Q9181_002102 [Wetmoreana brouardii]